MTRAPQQTPRTDAAAVVVPLRDLDAGSVPVAGGKAANLGELLRAGFPVPDGFCLTTAAYREMAAAAGLTDVLDGLAALAPDDVDRSAELARQARERILSTPMPRRTADAVTAAYRALGEPSVAVRSSATAEDLPSASFAGQQDTYLEITGVDAVLDAVHRCWASLWTDRAVLYRARNGVDSAQTWLAVVVQEMVDAAVAGVLFTANPVTGHRGESVVDASPGLGEAVVSGAVDPDHFVVRTGTGAVVERRIGDGTGRPACLTDEQVAELVRLGGRVQQHFGAPQDIEWAFDRDGGAWLTQARPVTTLFPLPDGAPPPDGLRVYFCFSLAQGLTRPLTPLGIAAIRVVASGAGRLYGYPPADPVAGPPAVRAAAGRLFFDVTPMLRSAPGRAIVPRVLDVMEARSAVVLRSLFDEPRLSVVQPSWRPVVRRVAFVAARYGIPLRAAQALVSPSAAHRRLGRLVAELRTRARAPQVATPEQRWDDVVATLLAAAPLLPRVAPPGAAGFAMLGLAAKVLGPDARPGDLPTVLRGLPANVTTEMDLDLWRLATTVRADEPAAEVLRAEPVADLAGRYRVGALPPVLQRGLAGFLDRYGSRAVAEIDLGLPRWAEDPAHVLGVLANYLRVEDPDRAPDAVFARAVAEAEAMVATLTGRARRRGRVRGAVVRFALHRARRLGGVRELPKYCIVLLLARARAQLRLLGADLVGSGVLDRPEDVSFLDLREVREGLRGRDLRDVVRERRAVHDRELGRRRVPRVLLSDGTEPEDRVARPPAGDGVLVGTGASAGRVTGPARVVLDPTGAHVAPGEVLVTPSTDPGWTPLFLTAGGLVMEMGGANSHGAVVAREYGIPAVVGLPGATTRITTGQLVTVDGTAGVVTVAEPGA
ncbi:PEP/pyruvate-binding domain-containing protein [Modestobacter sp. I12A-02662]|uniref:PEP/pyruvate-binding domain-containing protein n=1 Tax=Modestobacter sp. I12A-02662 TaxID=1730496 RepID=UPI0034DE8ACB